MNVNIHINFIVIITGSQKRTIGNAIDPQNDAWTQVSVHNLMNTIIVTKSYIVKNECSHNKTNKILTPVDDAFNNDSKEAT